MTKTDQKTGNSPLRPRARIMRTIGEELISSETVAVIELVKNSYDADADRVLLRFTGDLTKGSGAIEVIDNGTGMSIDTIKSAWMEPATASKRRATISRKGRRVLGEKGIGRFASSRLADHLEVSTKTAASPEEAFVLFDWTQFDNDDRYLDEIEVLWEERPPIDICASGAVRSLWSGDEKPKASELTHGTVLRMKDLKQNWGDKQFEDLRRGLSRLVSPTSGDTQADFEIAMDRPDEFTKWSAKIEPPRIIKYPHYSLKGKVEADGTYEMTLRVYAQGTAKKLRGQFRESKPSRMIMVAQGDTIPMEFQNARPPLCGPLDIEVRVWDRDDLGNIEQKTQSTLTNVKRDLDAIAGVNLYRDNFRVLPYGEPNNDWLRLDIRRVQNPTLRLSNNQLLGFIGITRDGNPRLKDQSNREGLDEGQPLEDLRQIVQLLLTHIEDVRYKARPRREKRPTIPAGGLFTPFSLGVLRDHVKFTHGDDKKAQQIIDDTEKAFGEQLHEIQAVLGRYQRLATLGQLIDVVLHDGRQPLASINNDAVLGMEDIEAAKATTPPIPILLKRFKSIHLQGDVLSTAFRRIEPFSGRRRGRPSQLYLENIIRDAAAVYTSEIEATKTKITFPHTETLVRVDQAEMQEVIVNLMQNSLYWLTHVDESKRAIVIKVIRIGPEHVDIIFSDSGPGVPADDKQAIFDPYYSTKPDGVGLGLTIAGEIVSDYYGGELVLLDSGPLSGATFRITLRKRV